MASIKNLGVIVLFVISGAITSFAQNKPAQNQAVKNKIETKAKFIQFSGVVVEADSLNPVPFANIRIKGTRYGTVCNNVGFFTLVGSPGDTVIFSSVGYKRTFFIVPDTLTTDKYSLIQVLPTDTVMLKTAVIYPWPSKEQFRDAFVRLDIPDDDLERARKNLARAEMKERMDGMAMDGSMNFKNAMQQNYSRLYYAGQLPPNNLLNPIAWAKFIKAWQNGEFKSK